MEEREAQSGDSQGCRGPCTHWGGHGTADEEGWGGVAVAGCCLVHPPTHPHTLRRLSGSTGRESSKCPISGVKFQQAQVTSISLHSKMAGLN